MHAMSPSSSPSDGDFSTLFNFLPIGAYRCAPDGSVLRANQALAELNGYDSETALVAHLQDIGREWYVDPQRRTEFQALLARDGFVRGFVSEVYRHRTREKLWVSENAHGVRDAHGVLHYYEGTVEDITAHVRDQKALQDGVEQLRLITSQVPGAVFAVHVRHDGTREYRFLSAGIRDIYGFEAEDLMRTPTLLARYFHPEDQSMLERDRQAILAGQGNLETEFRVVLPDGRIKWICNRSCAVSADEAGFLRVGVLLDITDRKEAEAALRDSEALWKLALESTGDGVWDWNLVTDKEYFSQGMKGMFGYDEADDVDLSHALDANTHPDDVAQMWQDRQRHFDGVADAYRNERRIRCKDGSWKWVLSRGVVLARDDGGKPLRMIGTHTDITEHKNAESQHRALEAQLRESQKMEAIGTLAGGVAHDFNNLLAAILGNLVLAREDVGEGHAAQESLAEIHRAAIRARQLVQQILTFSRRQTQEMLHQPLTPLVEEALRLMRSLLPAGLRLEVRLPSAALPVLVDATQMQQVLMNLCANAWQAMEGGSGDITVALGEVLVDASQGLQFGGLAGGAYACLSVADNGPGMDEATRERIFEPFFTTKAPGTGTGLGLAVVHGIVKAHRGSILVHSRPGEGARFDVYLPLASAVAQEATPGVAQTPAVAPPPAAAPGKHVVYIDDYEALVFLVGRLLRKQGYRTHTFESGEAAVVWLRENPDDPVDLIVTDQNMPGMSGIDVAREARRMRPGQRVAIVSGHISDRLLAEASAAGVRDVMAKQDRMDALGQAIHDLLLEPSST
ncbi:hybrid sensor histidine kinase/response regulator [Hydrogenophaga sp. BPS33]|uniref:hybrid sensor histidine kinase/response regulator n=1 Tax=Hydrogenophaga sp. BPS33 TaxID=2651974 RepID=UPI00131F87C5|nr:PAS domain-containing sensor histidine kinase [Hydrogenophaga sp. BPS33]QHE84202.1 PAS domain-containing protein [Hydrogenophaga sp. BPS33]